MRNTRNNREENPVAEIRAVIDGNNVVLEEGTTGTQFFKDQRDIIAMRVNGEEKDLYLPI